MLKGPLVYAAVILAAMLMVISGIMVADRDFFIANQDLVLAVSGIIAIGVIVVLILMLLRMRSQRP